MPGHVYIFAILSPIGEFPPPVPEFGYGLDKAGAIQYLDKAVSIDPTSFYALKYKGFILYKLGKYSEALVSLDRALKLDPFSYETMNNKGLALMKLGNYTQALSTFNIIIEASPYDSTAYYNKALTLPSRIKNT